MAAFMNNSREDTFSNQINISNYFSLSVMLIDIS